MRFGLTTFLAPALVAARAAASLPPTDDPVRLEALRVTAPRVALEQPAGTFASPVSLLRFEPRVDVQARNFAEAQADLAVRGGTFEQTGVVLGGLSLYDPQTGHYTAEIPVAPELLAAPVVLTGSEAARGGALQATAGTIAYDWAPSANRGRLAFAAGTDQLQRAEAFVETRGPLPGLGGDGAVAVSLARSLADGPVTGGDHEFGRANLRLRRDTATQRTVLFAGYQSKFFGWPNLYTPFNSLETENLQTHLFAGTQRWGLDADHHLQLDLAYRRHRDRYTFNRLAPQPVPPFQHQTEVLAAALHGAVPWAGWTWRGRVDGLADRLNSERLTFGPFTSRRHGRLALSADRVWAFGDDRRATAEAGLAWADTDRDPDAWTPWASASWSQGGWTLAAAYAETTQVAGYTALASSPGAGLFRGNPDLGRARARSAEVTVRRAQGPWSAEATFFRRLDRGMTDWTFTFNLPNARSARRIDLDTDGLETLVQYRARTFALTAGYAWLSKDADYGPVVVDASYYALNFPRHRATLAFLARPARDWEVRIDAEWREQEPNRLRRSSASALLASAGLSWFPRFAPGWELYALVDNLADVDFEEVPAVPGSPRTATVGVALRW